ncbi:MAG: LamG-like jellyroll fold domain-containing protein [Thermoguttaceae bacterium]
MKTISSLLILLLAVSAVHAAPTDGGPRIEIRQFQPDKPISRAGRPVTLTADVANMGETEALVEARLVLPGGVRLLKAGQEGPVRLVAGGEETRLTWEVEAEAAMPAEIVLETSAAGKPLARQPLPVLFLPAVEPRKLSYIPEPEPAPTELLIGAHHCPLWESDQPKMWLNVLKHSERTPALGFYSQDNPEVSDWETKWAVEHGVSFFIYCWYRTEQGGAVKTRFSSAIHDALFKSKFVDKMKFTIMWENQARGVAGVADERDLFENLLPYWMDTYFRHPSYLKVDNKPVLFIYRPEFLVQDLGSVDNVARAFDKMRQKCREAGFDGLYLLGEYRGTERKHLELMKSLGLDYTFAYCWHVPNSPTPDQAIRAQMDSIRKTQELGVLPQVVTVSQAWSGWRDEGSIWKIPPADYAGLLRQARDFVATLPKDQLGSRMLLLDNWNEWGEGHYIAPYREYGFGYLDAVRRVLSSAPEAHEDLVPEDIRMGPYDTAIREHFRREAEQRRLLRQKAVRPGAPEGLAAWWTFDEEAGNAVALDVSGHGLGGLLRDSARAEGYEGQAIVCSGGCVVVPNDPQLSDFQTLSIECRVKTETAGQDNRWMVNRVFGGSESSGFRLGLLGGKPCFHVPLTPWSHHLAAAEPLPLGRWVHMAATFDGSRMRLYVDGVEQGVMDRPGPLLGNDCHLVLGNYEVGHASHFAGLLDDVRLYRRVLPPEEIRVHATAGAGGIDGPSEGERSRSTAPRKP